MPAPMVEFSPESVEQDVREVPGIRSQAKSGPHHFFTWQTSFFFFFLIQDLNPSQGPICL